MTRRAWRLLAVFLLLAAATWQWRPLLLWHTMVEPGLRGRPEAERIHARSELGFPAAPAHWRLLESGHLSLRAPIAPDVACAGCGAGCRLEIDRGRLTIFSGPPPPAYQEALDRLAPDPGDLRVFRSRTRNWETFHALVDRVAAPGRPVESFRYLAAGSRGVVMRSTNREVERFVVYAYSDSDSDSEPGIGASVVALAGTDGDVARRILGTLRVLAQPAAESRCSS